MKRRFPMQKSRHWLRAILHKRKDGSGHSGIKTQALKANHTSQIYRLEDNIAKNYPKKISAAKEMIAAYEIDLAHYKEGEACG